VIAAIHAVLYLVPGLVFIAFAESTRRFAAVAIAAARGSEQPWTHRVVWLSVGLIGVTGVALLVIGSLMASIILRGGK
jgi:hypothetical protein